MHNLEYFEKNTSKGNPFLTQLLYVDSIPAVLIFVWHSVLGFPNIARYPINIPTIILRVKNLQKQCFRKPIVRMLLFLTFAKFKNVLA